MLRDCAQEKGEEIVEEQGHKQGRGIGFQLNAVIFIGVAVMVAILISFVGYRAYDELLATGSRAQYNELEGHANLILSRYECAWEQGTGKAEGSTQPR